MEKERQIMPVPALAGLKPYAVPKSSAPTDLDLSGNEGAYPPVSLYEGVAQRGASLLRNYPTVKGLEGALAQRLGIEKERVLVTCGGDSALDAVCRAFLAPGREFILPIPTFEMIERYARFTGGTVKTVRWTDGNYPTDEVIALRTDRTAVVAVVSPNNPTGAIITKDDLSRLAREFPQSLILLDHAYVEFAAEDLTPIALGLKNVVVVRTLSKAWGLAGLRIGYAVGEADVIGWLRAAANPYPVSGVAAEIATNWLASGADAMNGFVSTVRAQRGEYLELLEQFGAKVTRSQANFVFARFPRVSWFQQGLSGFGIAVRTFPNRAGLEDAVRVSMPGEEEGFRRLKKATRTVFAPQAVIFDIDGVLADVSRSYREAIVQTAAHFGSKVTFENVAEEKTKGDANNDWKLTRRILAQRGIAVSLAEVTAVFERIYQGSGATPGLRETESLIPRRGLLERLARLLPLGIVTGRPRQDAERFLTAAGISDLFSAMITMEDGPLKPDPAPLIAVMKALGVERTWFIGDTPDDIVAARRAESLPLGVIAPLADGSRRTIEESVRMTSNSLYQAGAAIVLEDINRLEELL